MREFKFTVNSEEAGKRLDKVITDRLTGYSRSQVKKLFELGNVYVDHKDVSAGKQKVEEGMQVHLRIPQQENFEIRPENIPINIVYEDEDVLVVNKPRGMVVHPAPGNYSGTLVNALLYYPGKEHLSDVNGDVRPGIVHRIDKDTSGLLMVAKNNEAHKSLAEQLYVHSIRRQYIALVQDNIKDDDGTIDAPIGRDRKNRMKRSVNGENPKRAVTHFHVLERFGFCTLIACQLETGRTHQIRVHMSSIKHPLVGDPMYGSRKTWKGQMAQLLSRMQGQLLHAQILGFNHPRTGKYMEFRAPLPEEFEKVLAYLREKR
ncbi:MAG: RluA family pseudouridine synthase [Eubacterium sp.]|jgi:23S rRNA pseudouridine1911/1915/1917 synthase|uniref:RluA family pseudouridine synthase n=1 Tax=Eubacterium sp. F2 TaxID=3381348 RepID=UPI0039081226|nr:RluA family pseudouridine synthase [Eubacterium sp.]MCI2197661.1 RluA family pseudouridine synthase [Eubacterium sp.]